MVNFPISSVIVPVPFINELSAAESNRTETATMGVFFSSYTCPVIKYSD